MVQERGEGFLQPARQDLLVRRKVVPRLDSGVARRQSSSRRHYAHGELVGKPPRPHIVPSFVVAAAVFLEVFRRCLVWGMGGAEGDV